VEQLVEIIKVKPLYLCECYYGICNYSSYDDVFTVLQVLGTPTREEIRCMNPDYKDFRFPQIKAHPWHKVCF
jgi:hypothetical protein